MKPESTSTPSAALRALAPLFFTFQLLTASGAPGSLDPTFNGTGESLLGFGGASQKHFAVAAQSDGKLILAGRGVTEGGLSEFEIIRLGTNNALDPTFGAGGVIFTAFSPPSINTSPPKDFGSVATAVAIQSDGKIVAAGWANTAAAEVFALARYNTNGTLDTSFGTGGKVATQFGTNDAAGTAIALQADGHIVVAGWITNDFCLARYDTNGVRDTSFGSSGFVKTDTGGGTTFNGATSLLIQPDGNYVAVGVGSGGADFAVIRYLTNGALDTSFGGTGIVLTAFPGYPFTYPSAVAYQSGNIVFHIPDKIVVAGNIGNFGASEYFVVTRYNLDGSLDTSFGTNGILMNSFSSDSSGLSYASAVYVTGGLIPKITIAGWSFGKAGDDVALARLNGNGTRDTTFGPSTNGQVFLPVTIVGTTDTSAPMTVNSGQYEVAYNLQVTDNGRFLSHAARFTSSGILDTTFGSNGVVTEDVCSDSSSARALAIQSDSKIVVAGYNLSSSQSTQWIALTRYNPDGSLDSSFGTNGEVTTTIGPTNAAFADAVRVQPDGKIVAAGNRLTGVFGFESPEYDIAVVRYNPNGSLDASFGSGGIVTTSAGGSYDTATSLALQPDGKIVAAGSSFQLINDDFAVVRYTTNGALDTSFGGTGKVITSVAGGESVATGLGIQPDQKIVLGGYAKVGSNTNFALVRYLTNGTLDSTFGSSGSVTTDFGGGVSAAYALTLQSDGKILAAGSAIVAGTNAFALARYLTNGTLDASFGTGGRITTRIGASNAYALAVAELPTGKIIAAGYAQQPVFNQAAIVRYNPNGTLDSSFGTGGTVVAGFADGDDIVNALALDEIGRPILAASANGLFGVARLTSNPLLLITSISQPSIGVIALQGLGVPATNNTLQSSSNLTHGSFNPLASVAADANGSWQYQDTNADQANIRFYRLSYP